MKKLLSFILSFVLILEIMSFTQAYALSPDLAEVASFDDNAILDEYSYYFNVPSRDIYQLSQEELNLPTEKLVDLILDYPYLVDFISASNPNETYQYIRNSFNGFAELETRTDATTILLSKLLSENDSYPNGSIYKLYVSSILSIPFYSKNLSREELALCVSVAEGSTFGVSIDSATLSINTFNNTTTYSDSDIAFEANGFYYVRSNEDGLTTGGITVPLYAALSDFTIDEQISLAEDTANAFNIVALGNATSMYNCHSYAWHSASTSNNAWILQVDSYMYDLHSENINRDDIEIGTIVVYFDANENPLHSAIISDIDGDNIICKSKWGANGLFEHHIANVPASYTYNGYTVWCRFYNYERIHTYEVVVNGTESHFKICNICGHTETADHYYNYTHINSLYHMGECIYCGHETNQLSHMWEDYSARYWSCRDCGLLKLKELGDKFPIIHNKIPDQEGETE